ncbi:Cadherin domain protein [Dirofilaria immitis]|nr:Cadherin domain protein [Dirofilaria immitis]
MLEPKIFIVRSNAPIGWLISDLVEDGYSTGHDHFSLPISNQSHYFQIINNRLCTKNSINHLKGRSMAIVVETTAPKRMFVINVNIAANSTPSFSADIYNITLRNDITLESVIPFETEIMVANLYVSGRLRPTDDTFQSFYIGALDRLNLIRLAVARIDINFEQHPMNVPKFNNRHYFRQMEKLEPNATVLRVAAKTSKGAVVYRIEPENAPFDVTPFSGDIFSRYGIPDGKYVFDVVATDSFAQEARANVQILVGSRIDPKRQFKTVKTRYFHHRRSRRDFGNVIVLTLKENHPIGLLDKKINLGPDENVVFAPATTDYLKIHSNGLIELIKPLNYEFETSHQAAVQISGLFKARIQLVRIEILDVDEPPVFQNRPKPYQAVVAYDQPIGMHVYKFIARDEAGDGDDDVEYRLINTEPRGTFVVDPVSGVVQTALKHYKPGETYRIFDSEVAVLEVLAGDRAPQFVEQQYTVHILEDTEPGSSLVDISAKRFKPIDKRRNKGKLLYHLYLHTTSIERQPSPYFTIDEERGLVRLIKSLDYDDNTQPKHYQLIVVASEDGKESEVPLDIYIKDVNDNAPIFTQPIYSATIKEDIPFDRTILTVRADDKDHSENARIKYRLDDNNFTINDKGEISARIRLDADQNRERFFIYRFNVTATDCGEPPLSSNTVVRIIFVLRTRDIRSKSHVHIRTENSNDEAPIFIPNETYHAFVAEDAQSGTPIVQIQAIDPDRDQVLYTFKVFYAFLLSSGEEALSIQLFEIDRDTGLIRLGTSVKPEDLIREESPYNLTVVARDDGSCCDIADVNNNKPEFRDCDVYSSIAKIEEGDYKTNSPVILKVVATDEDSPPNGEIVYSLYYSQSESRKPFIINSETGELRPSPFVRFDREQRAQEEVTVKATDKGERPLIGFCQFTIQVLDVNDNAPQFDRAFYETSISRSVDVGSSVLTVFADDADAPQNARIIYSLADDTLAGKEHRKDSKFFRIINENNGEITLANQIPPYKDRFVFNVIADDNGKPFVQRSAVQVFVNVHEKQQSAPQWQTNDECKAVVTVDEDIPINSVLFRCLAIPGDGSKNPISYKMANGANRGTNHEIHFREFLEKTDGRDWVVVRNMIGLDYEQQQNYTLTITAMDMRSLITSDKQFRVVVQDKNDVVPRFTVDLYTGSIEEEQTPTEFLIKYNGNPITVVKAEDADSPGPQSELRYRIIGDSDTGAAQLFRIDELTGGIFPLEIFDREKYDSFIFDVEACDSFPSSLPGTSGPNKGATLVIIYLFAEDIVKVQIFVADINDNAPHFEQIRYEARVAENAEINEDVITVKAYDLDRLPNLKYDLYAVHGGRIPFGVRTDSGALFVKEPLDYEKENVYYMKLLVTDGKHNATTDLFVYIDDVNDNAPQFEKNLYEITISEEERNLPKTLFIIRAIDADKQDDSSKIVYRLEGQGVGEFFRIGEYSGDIEVIRPLDRDPPAGVSVWKFVVQAIDDNGHGLIGYADVQVNLRDINDNAPIFASNLFGIIDENRDPGDEGVFVMTVTATDYDDPRTDNARLEYSIAINKEIDGEPIFRIVPSNGKIYAMRKLDRELPSEKQFVIEVRAVDKGSPSLEVMDVNDNEPYFEKKLYVGSVAETASVSSAVISVSASDKDTEASDNIFSYELIDEHQYFYITTETGSSRTSIGVLRVKKLHSGK